MDTQKSPNTLLAEEIFKELVNSNLLSKDNKQFVEKLASGKLKELDWKTDLLTSIHSKK